MSSSFYPRQKRISRFITNPLVTFVVSRAGKACPNIETGPDSTQKPKTTIFEFNHQNTNKIKKINRYA